MLSLHGQVERSPEPAEDLVPALAFFDFEETKVRMYIVDGEVRGGFPSDFTLEITSPPTERSSARRPGPGPFGARSA
jgi:hypothetical protein